MNAIAKIRNGIVDGDIHLIVDGYTLMTGEDISPSKKFLSLPADNSGIIINEIVEILEKYKDVDFNKDVNESGNIPRNKNNDDITEEVENNSKKKEKKKGRPKGSKNKKKKLSKNDSAICDDEFTVIEGEPNSTIGSTNNMKYMTTEPTAEDQEFADALSNISKNKSKRASANNGGECDLCGVDTEYFVKMQGEIVYMCNKCSLKRKSNL